MESRGCRNWRRFGGCGASIPVHHVRPKPWTPSDMRPSNRPFTRLQASLLTRLEVTLRVSCAVMAGTVGAALSQEFPGLPDQPCIRSCFSSAHGEGKPPCPGLHALLPQAPENARLLLGLPPTAHPCWTAPLTPLLLLLKLQETKFWNRL